MKRPPFHLPEIDRLDLHTCLELAAGAVMTAILIRWAIL